MEKMRRLLMLCLAVFVSIFTRPGFKTRGLKPTAKEVVAGKLTEPKAAAPVDSLNNCSHCGRRNDYGRYGCMDC